MRCAVGGLTAAGILVAAGVSRFGFPHSDGLEFVAESFGFAPAATAGAAWLADYGAVAGIDVGVTGVVGFALTALVVAGAMRLLGCLQVRPQG